MKLSDLGRGAHLQIRKQDGMWRATLRINTDDHGAGVQTTGVHPHPAAATVQALQGGAVAIGCLHPDSIPLGTAAAVDVAGRIAGFGCSGGVDMGGVAEAFSDPTLRRIADTLARADDGRSVDTSPITLVGEAMGWRGGGAHSAFGARRPMVRRYVRGARRRPLRRAPMGPHPHPYPHGYPPAYAAPYPYPVDSGQPTDDNGAGPDPAAAQATDPTGGNPSPASPASPGDVEFPDLRAMVEQDLSRLTRGGPRKHHGAGPTPAAPSRAPDPSADPSADPSVQGYMGWNPFHSISKLVHKAIHAVAHPPVWAQVIFPVLSPAAQKFAAEHVLGKQGDKLFAAYQGAMDAAASGHLGARQLLAAVPQIAQVAQAAQSGGAPAVAALASAAAQSGGAPDLNAIASQASQVAQGAAAQAQDVAQQASAMVDQGQGALDALAQDASSLLSGPGDAMWSPSPYYGSYEPSGGLPTRRPIGFDDAYGRIYGPQPGWFRFQKTPWR